MFKNNIKNNSCCLREDGSEIEEGSSNQNQSHSDSQDSIPAGDADSIRKAFELDYRRQIADLYLKRRGKGLEISPKDESFVDELIADEVPISVTLAGIEKAFDKFKPKNKKDEIKSLSYCEGIIYALHTELTAQASKKENPKTPVELEVGVVEDIPSEEDIAKLLATLRAKREG